MEYTTPTGICAIDGATILKEDAQGKGYLNPKGGPVEMYDVEGKAAYRYKQEALCKEHYFKAFTEVYPNEPLPAI